MLRQLLLAALAGMWASAGYAQSTCIGCTFSPAASAPAASQRSAPQRYAVTAAPRHCRTNARYCLEADSGQRRLSLYENGRGVIAWDIIMQSPGRVMRGQVIDIDLSPSWCPTPSIRRAYPDLPPGCLPPGHPQNAMGEVKISMNGDFAGTAIRIHDTRGFGPEWPNEDSAGCVRVLRLKSELLPRIGYGRAGAVEVVFF